MARQIPRGFVWLAAAATVEIEPLYIMRSNFDGIVIVIYPPEVVFKDGDETGMTNNIQICYKTIEWKEKMLVCFSCWHD